MNMDLLNAEWETNKKKPEKKKVIKKVEKPKKKTEPKPKKEKKPKVPADKKKAAAVPLDIPEYENGFKINKELMQRAQDAKLMEPIQKFEMMNFKLEKEKLILLKAAGDVAEIPFIEFLYFGYIEKINIDMIGMLKKLRPQLTNLIKERDETGVIRILKNEIRAVLTEVKKSQARDVKEWRRDL